MLSHFFAIASHDSDILYVPQNFIVISDYSIAYPEFPKVEVSSTLDCCFDFPTLEEIDRRWKKRKSLKYYHDFLDQRRESLSYEGPDFYQSNFDLSPDCVSIIIDYCLRNKVGLASSLAKKLFYECAVDAREYFEEVEL